MLEMLQDVYGVDNVYSKPDSSDWFDGYNGQPAVLFDDYYGALKYEFALKLFDTTCYPQQVQVKGGWSPWLATCIVITSNVLPQDQYKHVAEKAGNVDAWMRRVTQKGRCYYKPSRRAGINQVRADSINPNPVILRPPTPSSPSSFFPFPCVGR
jgi:hypothetical protein